MAAKKKLLLVDDDEAVLEYLDIKLRAEFDLIATQSPVEALDLAREQRPDLILCDIDLPDLDGGDVSATLFAQAETQHIPLVFLTGLVSAAELASKGHQLGGRAAISKQSPIEDIVARIRASLA